MSARRRTRRGDGGHPPKIWARSVGDPGTVRAQMSRAEWNPAVTVGAPKIWARSVGDPGTVRAQIFRGGGNGSAEERPGHVASLP